MEVPCYKQEKEYSCAVCCLRMMLEFYGREYEEEELEKLCKTTEKGTIAKNVVDAAKRSGFLALLCEGDLEFIQVCVSSGMPVIVYLRTKSLPWWDYDAIHAVVVTGIDGDHIYLNEPWLGSQVRCEVGDFVAAWNELSNLLIMIKPQKE